MAKRIAAVILAAGYSSRMGEFKPLLPLGDMTILERAVGLFLEEAQVRDIRVVVGYRAEDLIPLLQERRVPWVVNENYPEGMLSSVKAGIRGLDQGVGAFFMLPVDIPLVRRQTLLDLLNADTGDTRTIIYPAFMGRRGHPPLIGTGYRKEILGWTGEGGLRAFLNHYDDWAIDVDVADECILLDADRPEHYQKLLARIARYDIPTIEESMVILEKKAGGSAKLLEHSREVMRTALWLARALNERGWDFDLDLVGAAGLLHDLARGEPDHAEAGARILREMGYPAVGDVVATHMDILVEDNKPLSNGEIIYLADKLVQGDTRVSIEARFQERMGRFADDPEALAAIAQRQMSALKIKQRIEKKLGLPLEEALSQQAGDGGDGAGDLPAQAW
jgi:putative nucleotidyltransferase with HDIG domain